jgi:hypothetical protein
VTPSLTSGQAALLAAQKTFDLQNDTFETFQSMEASKEKGKEALHDAILAVIAGINGR